MIGLFANWDIDKNYLIANDKISKENCEICVPLYLLSCLVEQRLESIPKRGVYGYASAMCFDSSSAL